MWLKIPQIGYNTLTFGQTMGILKIGTIMQKHSLFIACMALCASIIISRNTASAAEPGFHSGDVTAIAQPGKMTDLMTGQQIVSFMPSFNTNKIPNANPVGAGARAAGMGSAFIAVADDATAASWNPGGLVQLERPEMSMVVHYINSSREISTSDYPQAAGDNQVTDADLNYLSAAFPFTLKGTNMVVSMNYQSCYNFNKVVDYAYHDFTRNTSTQSSARTITNEEYYQVDYEQRGYLNALSPAFALELTPNLSIGFALNIWGNGFTPSTGYGDSMYSSRSEERYILDPNFVDRTFVNEDVHISTDTEVERGINANLGILWKATSKLTLGAVLKTPFDMHVGVQEKITLNGSLYQGRMVPNAGVTLDPNGNNDWSQWHVANEQTTPYSSSSEAEYEDTIHFPLIWGLGASYRFNDAFTMSFSWTRTYWENFTISYDNWEERSGLDKKTESFVSTETSPFGDTIRVGMEYLIIREKTIIPVRAGFFIDPEPGKKGLDDYYGVTVGSGYAFGNRAVFDCAYQYRWSPDAGDALGVPDGDEYARQHKVTASIIYYF